MNAFKALLLLGIPGTVSKGLQTSNRMFIAHRIDTPTRFFHYVESVVLRPLISNIIVIYSLFKLVTATTVWIHNKSDMICRPR